MMNQTSEIDNALSETSNVLFWCFAMSMVLQTPTDFFMGCTVINGERERS